MINKLFLVFILLYSSSLNGQIKFDSFLGGSYLPMIDKDSNRVTISSEIWTQFRSSVGCSLNKNIFFSVTLVYAKVNYSDMFNITNQKYLNKGIQVIYRSAISEKLLIDLGMECIQSKYSVDLQKGIPIIGKSKFYLGPTFNLSYRILNNLYLTSNNSLVFKMEKSQIEYPIVGINIGFKYSNFSKENY